MPKTKNAGFTLLEMIVVAAIIGILAAVAIPVYKGYILRSRAAENATVLQGIRDREEAYFTEYQAYTASIGYTPRDCGATNATTVKWDGHGNTNAWRNLGFWPAGPTYYSYQVVSPYNAAGQFNVVVYNPPGTLCDQAHNPANNRPWVAAESCGDVDDDGTEAHFIVSSVNRTVCHAEEEDSEY